MGDDHRIVDSAKALQSTDNRQSTRGQMIYASQSRVIPKCNLYDTACFVLIFSGLQNHGQTAFRLTLGHDVAKPGFPFAMASDIA